jgi:hypothetical protein
MEFRLVYDGPLPSASNNSRKKVKHRIRTAIHEQLDLLAIIRQSVANRHGVKIAPFQLGEFEFWPLVRKEHAVFCHLDILFLRSGEPGSVIIGGDLDNRLKILFDALRMPHNLNELPDNLSETTENRSYRCLLEDDVLITGHSVTSDRLLLPSSNQADVRLIIQVHIEPMVKTEGNVGF